jgi:WD40 repeat protein
VAFAPDGNDLVVAAGHLLSPMGNPGLIYRAPVAGGQWDEFGQHGQHCAASRVVFTPDGRTLVSATGVDPNLSMRGKGEVARWDWTGRPAERRVVATLDGSVFAVAADPNGAWVAAGGYQGHLVTFNPRSEKVWKQSADPFKSGLACLAASADGSVLACGYYNGMVRLIDPQTHKTVDQYEVPEREVRTNGPPALSGLAYRPDKSLVGTVWVPNGGGAEIRSWVITRDAMRLPPPETKVFAMALAAGGTMLATGQQSGLVRIWDLDRNELVFESDRRGDAEPVYGLAFDRTAHRLASCSTDGSVRLWEAVG